jgi:hypothetical protein
MTRNDLIHKVARAIDPYALTVDARPHRFANAIIMAEIAVDIVWDEAVEACEKITANWLESFRDLLESEDDLGHRLESEYRAQADTLNDLLHALRSLKRSQSQAGTDDLCQASPGIKGETVSREGALQLSLGAEAMKHLGNVMSFFADLDEDDRCRAFTDALEFFNKHHPDSQIQGEPGFTQRICIKSPLGSSCRKIEERSDEVTAASADASLTQKENLDD